MLSANQARRPEAECLYIFRAGVSRFNAHVILQSEALRDALPMIVGSAEQRAIQNDPPDVEVQVVVPGDTDATVQLHAILQDRR